MSDGDEAAAGLVERSILFADITGSTRLISEQGDAPAREILLHHLDLMREIAVARGGVELTRRGDEIICEFVDADRAAEVAAAMHEGVAADSIRASLDRPIRLRIGFAHGPVLETDGTAFGATVHLASRLAALAKAGQTLTTRQTLDRLEARWRRASRFYDRCVLKGLEGEQEIHEILSDASVTTFRRGARARPVEECTIAVEIAYGAARFRVDASRPRLELGRDPACDLHIEGETVSRLHAVVEWNRDRVRIADLSTNGTLVEPAGAPAIHLHHESTVLMGEGLLRLGGEGDETAAVVAYRCVA